MVMDKFYRTPLELIPQGSHIFFIINKNEEKKFSKGIFIQESEKENFFKFISLSKENKKEDFDVYDLRKEEDQIKLFNFFYHTKSIYGKNTYEEESVLKNENELFTKALRTSNSENPYDIQIKRDKVINESMSQIVSIVRSYNGDPIKLLQATTALMAIKKGKGIEIAN